MLPRHSQGLYLIQRIRDEAHRYGITAHRKKRTKLGMASQLDSIPGIGPTRRKSLLKHFGSMDKIREASVEELSAVPGMNQSAAESIKAKSRMKNIWIVDDDEEMSRAMQLMLKMLNCNTMAFIGARPAAQTLLAVNILTYDPRYQHAGGQRTGYAGICQTPRRME